MRENFLDSELSALRNSKALFSTFFVSMTGTRLPDERAQAVRSLVQILVPTPNTESVTPQEKELHNTEEATIDLEEEEEELEEDVEIDRQKRTNVDRHAMVNIDRQCGNSVDRRSTPAEPAMERVYRNLPPFPTNKTQTKRELDKAICKKAFDKITLEMPLSDAIKVSPSIKKYVKDMVSNSFPAAKRNVMMVSEEMIPWRKQSHLVKKKHLVSTIELRNTHD
ncbi:hypothetical protein F2Q68_00035468 [Brassica cretica]|uniref:Uncharacterized protein n=1 Tax=Brassica cretica TaxID=69181 RepID=A0A8S9H277_BRACR|nr:hypothetical protein F2Q68_00035468 [Brassica cretica]